MHYLVYKTTNTINNMIYIGIHSTMNINDKYLGSGHRLKYAIKKYGLEVFIKEILHECSCKEEMIQKEIEIVNSDFLKRKDVYNISLGGVWSEVKEQTKSKISNSSKKPKSESHKLAMSKVKLNKKRVSPVTEKERENRRLSQLGKKASPETREKQRRSKLGKKRKPHSPETRLKMSEKASKMSDEHREKIRLSKLGKTRENQIKRTFKEKMPMSEEQRKKLSIANTGKKLSKEIIDKRTISYKTNKINKLLKNMEKWAI